MCQIYNIIRDRFLELLPSLNIDKEISMSNLHYHLFVDDAIFISVEGAKKALDELGIFECMGVIQSYHQANFDGIKIQLSDACAVADEVTSIIGDSVFLEIFGDEDNETWDDLLTEKDLVRLHQKAQKWLDENPEGINDAWLKLETSFNA